MIYFSFLIWNVTVETASFVRVWNLLSRPKIERFICCNLFWNRFRINWKKQHLPFQPELPIQGRKLSVIHVSTILTSTSCFEIFLQMQRLQMQIANNVTSSLFIENIPEATQGILHTINRNMLYCILKCLNVSIKNCDIAPHRHDISRSLITFFLYFIIYF